MFLISVKRFRHFEWTAMTIAGWVTSVFLKIFFNVLYSIYKQKKQWQGVCQQLLLTMELGMLSDFICFPIKNKQEVHTSSVRYQGGRILYFYLHTIFAQYF